MKAICAMALALAGCGGDGSAYDTVGDALVAVGEAYCDRAITCGVVQADDRDGCESRFVVTACQRTGCGDPLDVSDEDIDRCIDDIGDFSCSAVRTGQIPPRCAAL